jgi:flagellar export protein FliJ
MPPYRLQTLLEIRERAEEDAKQAFSEAMRALTKAQADLKKLEEDLEQRKSERKRKVQEYLQTVMKAGAGAGAFTAMNRFEDRLKDEEAQVLLEIDAAKLVVKEAERLVETRRMEMAEAAKEKKAIEKHKDSWKTEVRKEREGKEDLAQEEIGNTLHLQRTRRQS